MPTPSELAVERLLIDTLFVEFVHRSPMLTDGSKEVADVLVLFRDTLLIFQVKMPDDEAHAQRSDEKRAGWIRKNREKAIGQIGVTWRYIAAGKAADLQNERFPKQVLDAAKIKTVVGVAVVGDEDDVDEPAQLAVTKAGRDIPVVVLTMPQLTCVLRAFDTVEDFVGAVQAMVAYGRRLESIRKVETPITSCLAALVSYIDPDVTDDRVLYVMSNGRASRQAWAEFSRPGGVAQLRHDSFPASRLIDHIVTQLHQCADEYSNVRSWIGDAVLKREQSSWHVLTEKLASLNRGQRDAYGQVLVDVMEASSAAGRRVGPSFEICVLDGVDWALVFSAGPGTRQERTRWIASLVEIIRAIHGFGRTLGIATEPLGEHGHSFQLAWSEGEPIDIAQLAPGARPLVDYVRGRQIRTIETVRR